MENIQKYIYQVYKEKCFSAAARELYISQPALSAAISRFEKEMNIKIFDRTKQPISLTPQGVIYINAIEEIMSIENAMSRKFRALSDMSTGSLTIGGSNFVSYALMPSICSTFYQKFPGIQVTLDIGNKGQRDFLAENLKKGEIDLIFTYDNNDEWYVYAPLIRERIIIAIHKNNPHAEKLRPYAVTCEELIHKNYDKSKEIEDFSIFNDVEFISSGRTYYTTQLLTQKIGHYKESTYKIKNSRHSEMHYNMMRAGVGAVVIPSIPIIHSQYRDKDVMYFVPKVDAFFRTLYIARTHATDGNPIVENFIATAKEVCSKIPVL